MNKSEPSVSTGKRWLWLVVIWLLSVAALGVVAWVLKWMIRP